MTWQEISVQEFSPEKDIVLIDVREIDEYQSGHIPGAVNVPLSALDENTSQIPTNGKVFMVCRSGARSGRACDFLSQLPSHINAVFVNVGGGTAGWIAEGREVVTGDNPH